VLRVLHIREEILYLSGMLRGRAMSCPKKSMHTWDKRQLR
jgi:hypothetical protein